MEFLSMLSYKIHFLAPKNCDAVQYLTQRTNHRRRSMRHFDALAKGSYYCNLDVHWSPNGIHVLCFPRARTFFLGSLPRALAQFDHLGMRRPLGLQRRNARGWAKKKVDWQSRSCFAQRASINIRAVFFCLAMVSISLSTDKVEWKGF